MLRNKPRNNAPDDNQVMLGRRYQTRLAAGASNRTLARELGIVEGSIRNALLYAKAADLAGSRPGWPSEADIAGMSIREVRTLLTSDGTEDAPGLKRLKAAWQGADDADRDAFTRWAGLSFPTPEKVAAPIATTTEAAPPFDQKRLKARVEKAIARGVMTVGKLAALADVPSSSLRGWLKGRAFAAEHLPKVAAAMNDLMGG